MLTTWLMSKYIDGSTITCPCVHDVFDDATTCKETIPVTC